MGKRSGKRRPSKDAEAPDPPVVDPGPRPVSARQRAHRSGPPDALVWSAGGGRPGEDGAERPAAARGGARGGAPARRRARRTVAVQRRRNRRRPNVARTLLRVCLAALALECVLVLLFSPRLWVRSVRIDGLQTVSAERITERMRLRPRTNIVRLPVASLRAAVEREPVVAKAEVRRVFPSAVRVVVRERTPWATLKVGGICYLVDRGFVPFHKNRVPWDGLPLVTLAAGENAATPRLGERVVARGLAQANTCVEWAEGRTDFPLERIAIDPEGKLCLNRIGGTEIQLGSGADLSKKLDTLALLLAQRDDLRSGSVAYVRLYAYDAPAIFPRPDVSALPGSVSGSASAVHHP
jgi:hypothetical protein